LEPISRRGAPARPQPRSPPDHREYAILEEWQDAAVINWLRHNLRFKRT
jgi:hypothetical protein